MRPLPGLRPALVLLATSLVAAAPPLRLQAPGASAELSITTDGLLRVRAAREGAPPAALPERLDPPEGPAPEPQADGSWRAPGYRLRPEGDAVRVVPERGRPFRIRLEVPPSGLALRVEAEGATAFHGFGQVHKALAIRETRLELYHEPRYGDQTYLHIPFCFTDTGLALLANAAGRDQVDVDGGARWRLVSATGRVDLLAWSEPDPARLVARFYRLSGAPSLLPRWAFGYLQSRYGYRTEAEARQTVDLFRRFKLPLSALVLDLYWFRRMGDLTWNREAFPEPEAMAAWFKAKGVRLITISEPFFTKDSATWPLLAAARGLALDGAGQPVTWTDWWDFGRGTGGGIADPLSPGGRAVLVERYRQLALGGVDGFWIDLGEPERTPGEARFGPYTEAQFHNAYNLAWARLVREGYQKARPGQRPFLLSRSGYLGLAGLGASTWSGDVPATWKGLSEQIPLGLSASLSGLPYWGSDVGGFITRGGEALPPDPELYLRWHQFGAFTPVYRAHGHGAREPWIYGEAWLARVKAVLERRQQLLPYLYATAYQVWSEGLPMMRPLFFADPADPALRAESGAFLLGDGLLVAPILRPLEQEGERRVRLPKGGWVDAFTHARLEGGREVRVPLTLDRFPLFYREGAILPVDLGGGAEGLILVPGPGRTAFTVFSDDGESEAYRQGAGERLQVVLEADRVSLSGAQRTRDLILLLPESGGSFRRIPVRLGPEPLRQSLR